MVSNLAAICYNAVTMTAPQALITTTQNQPLIGIPFEENGKEVVRYFSEETEADKAISEDVTQTALHLAGAWSDLDWDEMERELDRIRHESKPTCFCSSWTGPKVTPDQGHFPHEL